MNNVVKLSVHKNNQLQRQYKELKKAAKRGLSTIIRGNITGYCLVSWVNEDDVRFSYRTSEQSHVHGHEMRRMVNETLKNAIRSTKILVRD